jgi:hypothetical protein
MGMTMTRDEVLQEAADAVAIEWIADELQLYPTSAVLCSRRKTFVYVVKLAHQENLTAR